LKNDRWGEPIPQHDRSYSLAAMFRLVTILASLLGWWMLIGRQPVAAILVLLVLTGCLAGVAASRQRGGRGRQALTAIAFTTGLLLVGGFIGGMRLAILATQYETEAGEFAAVVFGCYLVVAIPIVSAIAWLLLRAWLHLAADVHDR
jgi:hypothetical protein